MGTPEDVAQAVLFFCETDYATGAILALEGGRLLVP
jgi:NAD(P)-dependent dehydrogenase (short-subunit alcohol dehydrogenase family)